MQNKKVQYQTKWKIMNFKKFELKIRRVIISNALRLKKCVIKLSILIQEYKTKKMCDKAFNKSFLAFFYIPD